MCGEHVQLEMPAGIQMQMVSSWHNSWGSGVRKRLRRPRTQGELELRERVTGSREECGMSIGWLWALEEEQPAD